MKSKVLLMGRSGSGKTSMRSIIFANYTARDTYRLGPTLEVEHSNVPLLGNLVLNLWDCGGQDRFMENYFVSQRDHIFRNCSVLIYVFDVESTERKKDLEHFVNCLDALSRNSPSARIFCLFHKFDLIESPEERERVFEARTQEMVTTAAPLKVSCFHTSIWDETLYNAWSKIVYSLVPNVHILERDLCGQLCDLCGAQEVVLFERTTYLQIAHVSNMEHRDQHRLEKISNIIKQFKLSCSKSQAHFTSIDIRNGLFCAFMSRFTSNTNIMLVFSSPDVESESILMTIEAARDHFEDFTTLGE